MSQELHLIPAQKETARGAHVYIVPTYDQLHTSLKEMALVRSVCLERNAEPGNMYIVTVKIHEVTRYS